MIRKFAAESEKWPDRKLRYKDFPQFCNCTHLFGQPDSTIRLHAISIKRSTDLQELYTDELMLALRNVVWRIFQERNFSGRCIQFGMSTAFEQHDGLTY